MSLSQAARSWHSRPIPRAPRQGHRSWLGRTIGTRGALVVKAGVQDAFQAFGKEVARQAQLTFQPRTNGARIAGRAPGQSIFSEVTQEKKFFDTTTNGRFDVASFAAQLEEMAEERRQEYARQLERANRELDEASSLTPTRLVRAQLEAKYSETLPQLNIGEDSDFDEPMSGPELALLCLRKYGKLHDMAIKHNKMGAGMDRWVAFNIYVGHLAQPSHPLSPEEYLESVECVAELITMFDECRYVRDFMSTKPTSRRMLPSTPRSDTAVTLVLNNSLAWDERKLELADKIFSYRY